MSKVKRRYSVDLRHRVVTLAAATNAGAVALTSERRVEAEGEAGREDQAVRAAMVGAIRKLAADSGLRGRDVAVALPRADVVCRHIVLPDVPAAELAELVRLQAGRVLPFPIDQVSMSHAVLGPAEAGGVEVLLAAARRGTVTGIVSMIEDAGLKVGSVTIRPLPAVRSLLRAEASASEGTIVLADIDERSTEIAVVSKGRLVASRSASLGIGAEGEVPERWEARLAGEITRTVTSWSGDAKLDRLWVHGPGSRNETAVARLGKRLEVPVAAFSAAKKGPAQEAASVVGLVGDDEAGIPWLDLAAVAPTRRARSLRRNRAVLAVVAAIGLVAAAASGYQSLLERERTVEQLQTELAAAAPAVEEYNELFGKHLAVEAWEKRRAVPIEAILAVTEARPEKAYFTRFTLGTNGRLRLVGRAKDERVVQEMLANLDASPIIVSTSFESFVRHDSKDGGGEFNVSAMLREEMP